MNKIKKLIIYFIAKINIIVREILYYLENMLYFFKTEIIFSGLFACTIIVIFMYYPKEHEYVPKEVFSSKIPNDIVVTETEINEIDFLKDQLDYLEEKLEKKEQEVEEIKKIKEQLEKDLNELKEDEELDDRLEVVENSDKTIKKKSKQITIPTNTSNVENKIDLPKEQMDELKNDEEQTTISTNTDDIENEINLLKKQVDELKNDKEQITMTANTNNIENEEQSEELNEENRWSKIKRFVGAILGFFASGGFISLIASIISHKKEKNITLTKKMYNILNINSSIISCILLNNKEYSTILNLFNAKDLNKFNNIEMKKLLNCTPEQLQKTYNKANKILNSKTNEYSNIIKKYSEITQQELPKEFNIFIDCTLNDLEKICMEIVVTNKIINKIYTVHIEKFLSLIYILSIIISQSNDSKKYTNIIILYQKWNKKRNIDIDKDNLKKQMKDLKKDFCTLRKIKDKVKKKIQELKMFFYSKGKERK